MWVILDDKESHGLIRNLEKINKKVFGKNGINYVFFLVIHFTYSLQYFFS